MLTKIEKLQLKIHLDPPSWYDKSHIKRIIMYSYASSSVQLFAGVIWAAYSYKDNGNMVMFNRHDVYPGPHLSWFNLI